MAIPEGGVLRRWNIFRDSLAGVMLIVGLLLPWNISFGIGVTGTSGWVFGLLVIVTLLALGALAAGRREGASATLRLWLNTPYFVIVAGFVGWTIIQAIRFGGTGSVPPGIGPGVWVGAAGAVLAAQPVITGTEGNEQHDGARIARIIGVASLALAVLAVLFNLYWRTRYVLPDVGDPDTGTQNLVVVVGAILYGAVALIPVAIVARWLTSTDCRSRIAVLLLGSSTLVAGVLVWVLPVGRDLDAFHGIAQNTSTVGVGFEGYLAWVLVAVVTGTATVRAAGGPKSAADWRGAVRKCLLLIGAWCAGAAILRIFDLLSVSILDLPAPPYNSTTLMAFDLITAVLAGWLLINGAGAAAPKLVVALMFGALSAMTASRVVLGDALVPRSLPLDPADVNDVYGNTLTQQITSTFDVALCVLSLALLGVLLVLGNRRPQYLADLPEAEAVAPAAVPVGQVSGEPEAVPATVRIARPEAKELSPAQDRVAEVLAQSTQRFAAGTTYGDAGRR